MKGDNDLFVQTPILEEAGALLGPVDEDHFLGVEEALVTQDDLHAGAATTGRWHWCPTPTNMLPNQTA